MLVFLPDGTGVEIDREFILALAKANGIELDEIDEDDFKEITVEYSKTE